MRTSGCIPNVNCGNRKITYYSAMNFLFFISFILLSKYVLFNLFTSVIIEEFKDNYINTDNPMKNYSEDTAKFKESWAKFTVHYSGQKLSEKKVVELMLDLKKPLGFGLDEELISLKLEDKEEVSIAQNILRKQAAKAVFKMNLSCDNDGNIYFNDFLFAVLKRAYSPYLYREYTFEGIDLIHREERRTNQKIAKLRKSGGPKTFFFSANSYANKSFIYENQVNPLFRQLVAEMVLLAWKNFTLSEKDIDNSKSFLSEDLLKNDTEYSSTGPRNKSQKSEDSSSEEEVVDEEEKKSSNNPTKEKGNTQRSQDSEGRISYNIINVNINNNIVINNNITVVNSSEEIPERNDTITRNNQLT